MKKVMKIYHAPVKHWVGDGFEVHSMFSYQDKNDNISPFLLMDYNPPRYFEPNLTAVPRGVGEHPHRGFETVTLAYQGEVTHQDSYGGGGTIGSGDVQWMTAGSGLMHQEFHSSAFSQKGGMFEMVQLWVNLPAKYKMTPPKYQPIPKAAIPEVVLAEDVGAVRIVAGEFEGVQGAATTFTSINMWDIGINSGKSYRFTLPESHNVLLLVLSGQIYINDKTSIQPCELVSFEKGGTRLELSALTQAKVLLLTGEPIDEPVVGYGPFVMNSKAEILQAIHDVQEGKFGTIVSQT